MTAADQSAPTPVVHPAIEAQDRARRALEDLRLAAWSAGLHERTESAEEADAAAELSAAIADLVKLATHAEEAS